MLKEAKNYEFWSLKMKTMFKSQELWDLVENGFEDNQTDKPDQPLREKRKKDSKALFLIQQALHDEIFPLIAAATTSTQAWDVLKRQYLGNKKVTRKEEEKKEIEEETSIDVGHTDVGDSEAPEKKEGSREQAEAKAKTENKDEVAWRVFFLAKVARRVETLKILAKSW
ncbi:uncharacterized protein LOC129301825 isoform X2 [Prosopis cineraria]|uniref:uncharacterized protein LOC129301825 isoform X2 n=1 Tax=Prosopis cineraria TaxID=364024 RepID=UPI00240EFA0F|nr:uncharacterized protein LOC129301825 isoform X2 [Prosopis cineraria]